jgi:hypothetical protein
MAWAVKQKLPDPQSKLLLLMLANHSGRHETEHDVCWPSIKLLSEDCSMSEDTVFRRIDVLCGLGLITVTGRCGPDGRTTSNLYQIPVPDEYYNPAPAPSGPPTRSQRGGPPLPAVQTYNTNLSSEPGVLGKASGFNKPSRQEMLDYGRTKGLSEEESSRCWNYYESNGWRVGRNPMKNWQAAMLNWRKQSTRYRASKVESVSSILGRVMKGIQ